MVPLQVVRSGQQITLALAPQTRPARCPGTGSGRLYPQAASESGRRFRSGSPKTELLLPSQGASSMPAESSQGTPSMPSEPTVQTAGQPVTTPLDTPPLQKRLPVLRDQIRQPAGTTVPSFQPLEYRGPARSHEKGAEQSPADPGSGIARGRHPNAGGQSEGLCRKFGHLLRKAGGRDDPVGGGSRCAHAAHRTGRTSRQSAT